MTLYNILIWYAICGVLTNFIYDLIVDRISKLADEKDLKKIRLTIVERVWVGITWPIFTLIFIIKLITILNDKD
jgi:hypothetical protein